MRFKASFFVHLGLLGWAAIACLAKQVPILAPTEPRPSDSNALIESLSTHRPADSLKKASWTHPKGTDSKAVVWDKYSLALGNGGQRIFVFAAEFHPWRLPVPSLWRDILQKIKAAGFNTVDIYTHWGLIQRSPDPATVDLSGVNDLDFFLTVAKEVGLYVIVRPGPYINAETTAGGMAPWTVRLDAILRTNDTSWEEAWKPYMRAIAETVVRHQVTYNEDSNSFGGGSVIMVQADNEYHSGPTQRAYMKTLVKSLKDWGVTVPISYNDPSREQNFVDLVDLYGLDSYPQRFDCSHPDYWVRLRTDYLEYHEATNPDQPFMVPEFQGGSYDPYGGPGYEACQDMTGADFSKVANQALIAQRVTLLSIYMVYGGTNWGGLAEPDVYTSYSYGAAITEARQLTTKYDEYKAQGHFLSTFPDLAMTEVRGVGKGHRIVAVMEEGPGRLKRKISKKELWSTELYNPDTRSRFYIVRQHDNASKKALRYSLEIETLGEKRIVGAIGAGASRGQPAILLDGRDSRVIPVDQQIAPGLLLRFTTANVFLVGKVGDAIMIVLYGEPGDTFQWSLAADPQADTTFESHEAASQDNATWGMAHSFGHDRRTVEGDFSIPRDRTQASAIAKLRTSDGIDIVLGLYTTESVYNSYAPYVRYETSNAAAASQAAEGDGVFGFSDDRVLVSGARLVRNATYTSTESELDTLRLFGSLDAEHAGPIEVFARSTTQHVFWNGVEVNFHTVDSLAGHISIDAPGLSPEASQYEPPRLAELEWKYADSLPEASAASAFDDSGWTNASKTSSPNPYWKDKRIQTQGKVLFASEYGYHGNNIIWRGSFDGEAVDGGDVGIEIEVEGGKSFAFSAWLNGVWLGSAEGDREHAATKASFPFPADGLDRDGKNVVTIVQDHMGLEMEYGALPIGLKDDEREELEAVKLPRGILSYSFYGVGASSSTKKVTTPNIDWKVAGNLGGEDGPDRVRTTLNEGGLYAERQGWHLPGFDDSSWPTRSPTAGVERPGSIAFFRTSFRLEVPADHDLSFAIAVPPFPSADNSGIREGGRATTQGNYRLQIYVNGWQMGKQIGRLGPQTVFPVHSGVLNHHGDNTLAISLWSLGDREEDGRLEDDVRLVVLHRSTGEASDGYVLEAPTWQELRGKSAWSISTGSIPSMWSAGQASAAGARQRC